MVAGGVLAAVMVLVSAVLVGSGTIFTAKAANPANVFTSGVLQLSNSHENADILTMDLMKPGDQASGAVSIKNTGNLDCTVQKPNFGNLIPFTQPDPAFTFGTFTPALPSTLKPGDAQSIEVVFSPTSSTGQLPFQTNFISVQTSDGQTTECGSGAGAAGCKEAFLAGTGVVLTIDTSAWRAPQNR